MKVLLCSSSYGSLEGTLQSNNGPIPPGALQLPWGSYWQMPVEPLGILRISSYLEKNGYSSDIYDINNLRPSDEELIKNFKRVKPTVVGLSGILSNCYPYIQHVSKILRELFPDIWIVLGGHLAGSSNVVLEKTEVDICIVGDGEIPFLKLLEYFKLHPTRRQLDYTGLHQIKGLAFTDENNKLRVTGNAEQLSASEGCLHCHDFEKLRRGLQKFSGSDALLHEYFPKVKNISEFEKHMLKGQIYPELLKVYERNKNKKMGSIHTSKGCVARCTFCQRQTKGYRVFSIGDLETHIIKLKEKYNIGVIMMLEENFGSNKKQAYEIARLMKKHDIDWVAPNMRCTSVTYEDLKFYKEHNMFAIKFGIESGSQKILDIMEKKITTKNLYDAIVNCKKIRIQTIPQNMIIGMPGETDETVIESAEYNTKIRHILGMHWIISDPGLLIATPGTPVYEYCQQIGVIGKTLDEEEDYLINLESFSDRVLNYVNMTNVSIKDVHYWTYLYHYAGKKAYVDLIIKSSKSIKNRLLQIYDQCLKATFNDHILRYNFWTKKSTKNNKLLQKIKYPTFLMADILFSLSILILPKNILFRIIRVYANIKFYFLNKNYRLRRDKLKSNLFTSRTADPTNKFRITEDRIAKKNRQVERSLRNIDKENRKQMRPVITDEEKGLQVLAEGQ